MGHKTGMCKGVAVLWALLAATTLTVGMLSVADAAWAKGEPQADDPFADAVKVDVEDGMYLVDVSMEGGTGKADVASPAKLEVKNGQGVATIEWSSPNYDYMVVAGKQYLPVNTEGDSVFVIPVTAYDEPMEVAADTTAMSEPHEIDYTFTFDSGSMQASGTGESEEGRSIPIQPVALLGITLVVVAISLIYERIRRKKNPEATE